MKELNVPKVMRTAALLIVVLVCAIITLRVFPEYKAFIKTVLLVTMGILSAWFLLLIAKSFENQTDSQGYSKPDNMNEPKSDNSPVIDIGPLVHFEKTKGTNDE